MTQPRLCQRCHEPAAATARFCGGCGMALAGGIAHGATGGIVAAPNPPTASAPFSWANQTQPSAPTGTAAPPPGQSLAAPAARAFAPPPVNPGQPVGAAGPANSWTSTAATPKPAGSRRHRGVVLAVVLAVAAAGVSALLIASGTGASTANAAIHGFADDVQGGRLLDAAGLLHPSEAKLIADLDQVLSRELTRLEVIRPDFDFNRGGDSVRVSGLRFDDARAEQVRDNVVIHKLVAGTITLDPDIAKTPLSESFRRLAFPAGLPATTPEMIDIAEVVRQQQEPVRIATVRVDGRWYVSLAYTGADYYLKEEKRSWAGAAIPARGADSAEDAVRQSIQAVMDEDYRRMVELAPPSELQVVHDLGEAIVAENPGRRSQGPRLLELETEPSTVDGQTALTITKVSWQDGSGQVTFSRDGECVVGTKRGKTERYCGEDLPSMFFGGLYPSSGGGALGPPDLTIIVVKDGGQYYVSPARSLVQIYGDILRGLQPSDISAIATAIRGR